MRDAQVGTPQPKLLYSDFSLIVHWLIIIVHILINRLSSPKVTMTCPDLYCTLYCHIAKCMRKVICTCSVHVLCVQYTWCSLTLQLECTLCFTTSGCATSSSSQRRHKFLYSKKTSPRQVSSRNGIKYTEAQLAAKKPRVELTLKQKSDIKG